MIISIRLEEFVNDLGDRGSILSRIITKTQKMVLDASLLNSIIRFGQG